MDILLWLSGLALVLGAALVIYERIKRRTTRPPGRVDRQASPDSDASRLRGDMT